MEWYKLIIRQSYNFIEVSQLICSANQLTGVYMISNLEFNELTNPELVLLVAIYKNLLHIMLFIWTYSLGGSRIISFWHSTYIFQFSIIFDVFFKFGHIWCALIFVIYMMFRTVYYYFLKVISDMVSNL